jgi:formate dehydrogenase subunit delta
MSDDGQTSGDKEIGRLVYMANQIGVFFASRPEDEAIEEIADHLRKFWDPRMRRKIIALVNSGPTGLSTRARNAVLNLE